MKPRTYRNKFLVSDDAKNLQIENLRCKVNPASSIPTRFCAWIPGIRRAMYSTI
jgi:hypothetical protein